MQSEELTRDEGKVLTSKNCINSNGVGEKYRHEDSLKGQQHLTRTP